MSVAAPPAHVRALPWRWARSNLFSSWPNTILTLAVSAVALWTTNAALRFVFSSGRWGIIGDNLTGLLVGLFPRTELWRVWLLVGTIAVAAGAAYGRAVRRASDEARPFASDVWRRTWPLVLFFAVLLVLRPSLQTALALPVLAALAWAASRAARLLPRRATRAVGFAVALLVAGALALVTRAAGWDEWGGLLLTLFLAAAGIAVSFPIGVVLALGRRSSLPAVRALSVGYIELIRGVPLVALLFMGSFVVGFLFPPGTARPSLVVRALIALVAFTSAYVAEVVRGGLQSVPKGQIDAALAVGLSPFATTRLVVLPQALRAVIPALVGQFISLFKDTSLVAIIGLAELLRFAQGLTSQPRFVAQGLQAEVLAFVSFVYWVGSYTMSRETQRLERRLGVGER